MLISPRERAHWQVLVFVVLALLCLGSSATAVAAPTAPAATSPAPPLNTQAAHLATLLRKNPVHVTDQLPRSVPRFTAEEFTRLARTTGVPTYVLVLPGQRDPDELLKAVHEHLRRDGVYVLVDESGVVAAKAYGVKVPAEDAATVALYDMPVDAGPVHGFARFVEVLASGEERAEEAAERTYETDPPDGMYIGPSDRDNQSFATGIALSAVAVAILFGSPYVRRWWHNRPANPRRFQRCRLFPKPLEAFAAIVVTGALAGGALLLFDEKLTSAAPNPRPADMTARLDRVTAGLKQSPVYTDPESPQVLSTEQRAQLVRHLGEFKRKHGEVYITLVPQVLEDESEGFGGTFSAALRQRLGVEKALFLVADPLTGDIGAENQGLELDLEQGDEVYGIPESLVYPADDADDRPGGDLAERLDKALTYLDDLPKSEYGDTGPYDSEASDPAEGKKLRPLFSGDFVPGLFIGAFGSAFLLGLLAAVLGVVRIRQRRSGPPRLSAGLRYFDAPRHPSAAWLRGMAEREVRLLAGMLTYRGPDFAPDLDPYPEVAPETEAETREQALRAATEAAGLHLRAALRHLGHPDTPPAHAHRLTVARTVTPSQSAAAISLARLGRAALTGVPVTDACAINPLHGPSRVRRDVRFNARTGQRRWVPVCEFCENFALAAPQLLPEQHLLLPADGGGEAVPYEEVVGPLAVVPEGGFAGPRTPSSTAHIPSVPSPDHAGVPRGDIDGDGRGTERNEWKH
ncbi:hypothetical protein HUT18_20945 [Streptomyces sp. NA04227]|uniref:hypothetical protein n=1 Tax=Streptomyces sp. NA04227 TaxID=2742136 RepID=UPI0015905496|nr:hypothetical protein [Streptomyces sp. NA04227]QKW08467.1 hypothetical protein HUT18_20945 [Streptomyces sp. NA04227]